MKIAACTGLLLLLVQNPIVRAAELIEVNPLTRNILLLQVSEGDVTYPNTLNVVRLDIPKATSLTTYSLSSTDDADYSTAKAPASIGRKSKGMSFVSNSGVPWGGSSFDPRTKPWASEHYIYLVLDKPLKKGFTYTLNTGTLVSNGSSWEITFEEKDFRSEAVHVNTLGYAPQAPKYGYVYQWMGDKGNLDLSAYNGKKFWLYKEGEDLPVHEGTMKKRTGATNAETGQPNDTPNKNFLGAEVYECNFSAVTGEGTYTLVVEEMGSSFPFRIGADPVWDAYYHGARSLYHQRSGIRLAPPYTAEGYIRPVTQNTRVTSDNGTDFSGKLLYCTLPYVEWQQGEGGGSSAAAIRDASIGNPLDVAGWYHDAGDWDGYFSHQRIPIMLMLTYEAVPQRFMDGDLNIPESGNGIPDVLDEASWLIKFNYRLRKELIAKGFSTGGVGGARVAPDFFTSVDGNAESSKPSWQDHRRYVVSSADAYMTYIYAGQAAQFAYILKSIGRDPGNFAVEMLDHVNFAQMTKDNVSWIQEAEEAFAWASAPANQPSKHAHYGSELWVYRMYAATSLYRLTGKEEYHLIAKEELEKVKNKSNFEEDQRYGAYLYLMTGNVDVDKSLKNSLQQAAINTAKARGVDAISKRGTRWGGVYDMPMLIGQGTTPWMFETVMAYALTGEKNYADAVHTTADYFLGNNPLHTTWMTGVGPRPARGGFHLDTRYLWDNNWMVYPGFVPYGPWSMAYDYMPFTWTIDGVAIEGGAGPWNKDWANFSVYPKMVDWPGHERYNNNIHAPMSTENTIHQQSVYVAIAYGFVNNRENANAGSTKPVTAITLDNETLDFAAPGDQGMLVASLDIQDATFPALKWTSADPRVAHVDGFGRVTGVTGGTTTIKVSTLDGSVEASCVVTCNWTDTEVTAISVSPTEVSLFEGQTTQLTVTFDPSDATNQFVDWTYSEEGIVEVDESNRLIAKKKGEVTVTATSLKDAKTASIEVVVEERVDHVIADFDAIIPVTTVPQPDVPQVYTPEGTGAVDADNPLVGSANPSEKVFQWNRPTGEWRLMGMVLPTDGMQDLSKYSQFQFKYFGAGMQTFFIQLITDEGTNIEINLPANGEDCWKLFTYNLSSSLTLKQFNVFVNPSGSTTAGTFYFDDFMLSALPATLYNDLNISNSKIELESGQSYVLAANTEEHPFTWLSTDPGVATVDQNGLVTAIAGGVAIIKAVALYGNTAECEVIVDGGSVVPKPEQKMIVDFENITLNWNPYGAYAWGSDVHGIVDNPAPGGINTSGKVLKWERDGAWNGFAVQFPVEQTADWDRLIFQVYCAEPTNYIRLEFRDGDNLIKAVDLNNLGIPANTWGSISIDISTLVSGNTAFSRLQMQPLGASTVVTTYYLDNIFLERDPHIPVESLSITGAGTGSIDIGNTLQLAVEVIPSGASNPAVTWSSSNEAFATVSATGLVTGVAKGTAIIKATSVDNPAKETTVSITVVDPTGLGQAEGYLVRVYPNPSGGIFTVLCQEGIQSVELIDRVGKSRARIVSADENLVEINIPGLEPGFYMVRVITSGGKHVIGKHMIK